MSCEILHFPTLSIKKITLMASISSNLPPRKLKSNLSVQIQVPNDQQTEEEEEEEENHDPACDVDFIDIFSTDEFRMYEFKVRRCPRSRSHDWTDCPFAHPGEKARRRDPRRHHYAASGCPDYKSSAGAHCPRGDACEFAHGVFECWLHPARYRTTPCKDGWGCRRKVCFFAHTRRQLRAPTSPSSPSVFLSPTSTLVWFGSPPPVGGCSGKGRRRAGRCAISFGELVSRLEEVEISLAVTGSSISTGGDVTDSGCYVRDFEWVDELLE